MKSNNTSKSNNNKDNNKINNDYSNHSSFMNSKNDINSYSKENNFKDFTQMDKFNFIQQCIKKVAKREQEEQAEINDLKSYEITILSKIKTFKEEIDILTRKIDETKIERENVEKNLKNKKVFLEAKMGKEIDENNNKKTMEEIHEINEGLKNDIEDINKEMELVKKDIEEMSEQSLETHQDIDKLKEKCEELIRGNMALEKRIKKKEKELEKINLDNKKLNDKIGYQELNSENFLKQIEKWANKKTSSENNKYSYDGQQEQNDE